MAKLLEMMLDKHMLVADEMSDHSHQVSVGVSLAVVPLASALISGQTKLDPKAHCYLRYKFYDKGTLLFIP